MISSYSKLFRLFSILVYLFHPFSFFSIQEQKRMVWDLIRSVPDEASVLELINRFDKLLLKYAKKLPYEDAYDDFLLFFIELLTKMKATLRSTSDGAITNYIAKAVKNHYIKLSKENSRKKEDLFSELSEAQLFYVENLADSNDDQSGVQALCSGAFPLSPLEYEILTLIYEKGYTVSDLARITKKSRQAVNQVKLRAIRKLRETELLADETQ